MLMIDRAKSYFKHFSKKDIDSLSNMFSQNIRLEDWTVKLKGKKEVINFNKKLFKKVKNLKVEKRKIYKLNNIIFAFIIVHADKKKIKVLDVIKFDKKGLILSIDAYHG